MSLKNIIIVGAGGCGREIVNWIDDINDVSEEWNILGFIDDNPDALEGFSSKYRVIGPISGHEPEKETYYAMGIAGPAAKKAVSQMLLGKGARFASIIHPSTRIYAEEEPGMGLITYPNSKIATGCRIGDFVTLQSTILGHDVQVEDYVTVSSSCGVTGGVKLHEGCFIGDHAAIAVGLEVGENAYVGIGSVVIRNVESGTKVFGNPARVYAKKE